MSAAPTNPPAKTGWVRILAVVAVVLVAAVLFLALGGLALIYNATGGRLGTPCSVSITPAPAANYDEQLYLVQGGDSGAISYDVAAVAQSDANGYGPAYLVNGLTPEGFWYQVGLAYDWACTGGHLAGFYGVAEVWNAKGDSVLGPSFVPLSVSAGDAVNLSLTFSGGNVMMSANDISDGQAEVQTYSAEGASSFEGGVSADPQVPGAFTGVMTEWYHVNAYYGGEDAVLYSANTPIAGDGSESVTLAIDEKQVPGTAVFTESEDAFVATPGATTFTYDNATEQVNETAFETGS